MGIRGKWTRNCPIPGRQLSPREKPGGNLVVALLPRAPGLSQGKSWMPGQYQVFPRETVSSENTWDPGKNLGFFLGIPSVNDLWTWEFPGFTPGKSLGKPQVQDAMLR